MKRKKFILLATTGVAALAIPTWYFKYGHLEYDQRMAEPELLAYIWDTENIIAVGNTYRKLFPDENSERKLVTRLQDQHSTDTKTLTESLQEQIVEDYQQNQIVLIDGWLLSATEARQCALFSIIHSK